MNSLSSPILYPALRSLIVNRLQKSIVAIEISPSFWVQTGYQKPILNPVSKLGLQTQSIFESGFFLEIPLHQINTETQIEYGSALAFKLTQFQSLSTSALAEQIQINLNHLKATVQFDTFPERIWQNFMIAAAPPGWIHLRLTDSGIAEWLQWTIDSVWHEGETDPQTDKTPNSEPATFAILHAYARCNSLLYLGETEKLIQFESGAARLSQPIPWQTEGRLNIQHHQDWALLQQLCAALDHLATAGASAQPTLKVALRLSQTFQRFHATCRIWGLEPQEQPLARTRLGLVLLTRKVLHAFITARLGWQAHSVL